MKDLPPMLLLKDIERRKPHPYEMLSFGQWIGYRFKWSRELRLEIFPKTPYSIYRYANDNIINSYPETREEASANYEVDDTVQDLGIYLIVLKGELLGYYNLKVNYSSSYCSANVVSIAGKITTEVVTAVLSEIQSLAKYGSTQNIGVDWDLPHNMAPINIDGLGVSQSGLLNNYFSYSADTNLPPVSITLEPFQRLVNNKQSKLTKDYFELSSVMQSIHAITFAIRNEDDKFLGLAILSPVPNVANVCNLRYLFVDASLRGQGMGHKLLKLVEACLSKANINNIVLETDEFMVPSFYVKRGYTRSTSTTIINNVQTHHDSCMYYKRLPNADGSEGTPPVTANPLRLR